jgi:hypothetical protein
VDGKGGDRLQAGRADRLDRQQRLPGELERLRDDEVDSGFRRPRDLLVEHRAHRAAGAVVAEVEVGVAHVAGEQRPRLARHIGGDRERFAVERLEQVLRADEPQLLAVGVVRERLDDVRARVNELAVEVGDDLGCSSTTSGTYAPACR